MSGTVLQIRERPDYPTHFHPPQDEPEIRGPAGSEHRVDGSICLTPQVAIDRSQAYFWTKRWQEGERQAEEDFRAGRVRNLTTWMI